jgi:hypothetical protein
VKDLVDKHNISSFLVAHSYSLDVEDVVLPALPKVTDQIRVREKKDKELEDTVKVFFYIFHIYRPFNPLPWMNSITISMRIRVASS